MRKGRRQAGESSPSLQDAVDWLVENTSEAELDRTVLSQWRRWSGDPRNSAAYAGMIEWMRQLRQLPPPSMPSAAALLADVAAERRQTLPAGGRGRVK